MVLQPTDIFPKPAFQETVQDFPTKQELESVAYASPMTWMLAGVTETLPAWSFGNLKTRDRELRGFWKSETILAGAMNSVCMRNAAYEWSIEGDEKTAEASTEMLHGAIAGNRRGWVEFIYAISQDLLGTDNGAFIEVIRKDKVRMGQDGMPVLPPVIGIGHLDSLRCFRTGNPDIPVIYENRKGDRIKMPWWSIIPMAELPSPEEEMRGAGFCAVSRVLRYAQLLKNIATYKSEKVSGRFYRAIHFVGGVSKREIDDIQKRGEEDADNKGLTRYIMPQIIASLDPEKPISTATIDLAALPDNFDLDAELKWYITSLAMGFGVDYQDFAPLPGGNLGTSTQSEVLHRKSTGKGPAVFMQTLQNIFHWYGVLPKNVQFVFHEKDLASEQEETTIKKLRIEARAIQIRSGEITPQVAREIAVREGDLEDEDIAQIPEDYGEDFQKPDRAFTNGSQDDTSAKRVTAEPKEEFD